MSLTEPTRRSFLGAAAMLAAPACAQAQQPAPAPPSPSPFSPEPFVIGGGPVGAAYNALGAAIAKLLVRTVPGLSATSAVTKGGFDNVDRVASGHADMASRPGESHPQALLEPCLNLSVHTAPDVRP